MAKSMSDPLHTTSCRERSSRMLPLPSTAHAGSKRVERTLVWMLPTNDELLAVKSAKDSLPTEKSASPKSAGVSPTFEGWVTAARRHGSFDFTNGCGEYREFWLPTPIKSKSGSGRLDVNTPLSKDPEKMLRSANCRSLTDDESDGWESRLPDLSLIMEQMQGVQVSILHFQILKYGSIDNTVIHFKCLQFRVTVSHSFSEMVVRDRLIEMRQLSEMEEGRPLKEQKSKPPKQHDQQSLAQFMENVDEIRHILMTLSMDRETIRREQVESLAAGVSDTTKSRRLNEHVDRFIRQATALRERLAQTNAQLANVPESGYGIGRARHEQVRALNTSFETIMRRFNEEQIEYKDRAARKIGDYLRKQNIEVSDSQIEEVIESGSLFQLTRNVHLGVNQKKALFEDVKSRTTDIMVIEKQIREIAELFQDMHMMVNQQGDTIERIELSVSNATEYAGRAERNVKEAVVLNRRSRKWKIISLIAAIILILVLIAVLKVVSPI